MQVFHLALDGLSHTLGHVFEDDGGDFLVGALEGDGHFLGIHFPEESLDGNGVQDDDIFEDEHPFPDFFGKLGILPVQFVEDEFFRSPVDVVHDLGNVVDAPHFQQVHGNHRFELPLQNGFHLSDDLRGGLVHPGNPLHHIHPDALGKLGDDGAGLVRPGIGQDQGDGLRMFVDDHVHQALVIRLPDELEGLGPEGLGDPL